MTGVQTCALPISATAPKELTVVPKEQWQPVEWDKTKRNCVWRSRDLLVQIFSEGNGVDRISVNRTDQTPDGKWKDGITWDELQAIKHAVGYGACIAVEMFPPDDKVINVANMRHLFVILWCGRPEQFNAIIPWWNNPKITLDTKQAP